MSPVHKILGGKPHQARSENLFGALQAGVTSPVTSPRLTNGLVAQWRVGLLVCVSGEMAWMKGRRHNPGEETSPKEAANYYTCQCSTTDKINSETQTVFRKPNTII